MQDEFNVKPSQTKILDKSRFLHWVDKSLETESVYGRELSKQMNTNTCKFASSLKEITLNVYCEGDVYL